MRRAICGTDVSKRRIYTGERLNLYVRLWIVHAVYAYWLWLWGVSRVGQCNGRRGYSLYKLVERHADHRNIEFDFGEYFIYAIRLRLWRYGWERHHRRRDGDAHGLECYDDLRGNAAWGSLPDSGKHRYQFERWRHGHFRQCFLERRRYAKWGRLWNYCYGWCDWGDGKRRSFHSWRYLRGHKSRCADANRDKRGPILDQPAKYWRILTLVLDSTYGQARIEDQD